MEGLETEIPAIAAELKNGNAVVNKPNHASSSFSIGQGHEQNNKIVKVDSSLVFAIRLTGSRFARALENIASGVYTKWVENVVNSTRFDRIDTNRFPCCRFVIPEVDLQGT